MSFDHVIVTTTMSSPDEAEELARAIVDARLGACVQCAPITSFYVWRGEATEEPEVLLQIKTRASLLDQLERFIKQNHPYDTPEILATPVVAGSEEYLTWVDESTLPS